MKRAPAQDWTADQLARKARAETGECVVADMHRGTDDTLIAWAKAEGRFVRIDRKTEWGNPFGIPGDGDRPTVCAKHRRDLPNNHSLLSRTQTLRGKVLGCWCHPEECHGHLIAEIVNREAAGEGSAQELAGMLARQADAA